MNSALFITDQIVHGDDEFLQLRPTVPRNTIIRANSTSQRNIK